MGWMIYITGGAYSGKESFANDIAKSKLQDVLHITANDQKQNELIDPFRMYRGKIWHQVNQWNDLDTLLINAKEHVALIDNISDFVLRWIEETTHGHDMMDLAVNNGMEKLKRGMDGFFGTTIVVTTEMGMGISTDGGSKEHQSKLIGAINRRLASFADEAWFVVSGIPTRLK